MQNKKSISLNEKDKNSGLRNIGTVLSKDQMKKIQGGSCQNGGIYPCSQLGSCGVPVGGGMCCDAYC